MLSVNDIATIVKGYKLGALEYICKPFHREEVEKRVSRLFQAYTVERIRLELEQTVEKYGMLYSVISRNLREPLGSLRALSHALLSAVESAGMADRSFEDVVALMNKMTEETYLLMDNLSKWSKIMDNQLIPFARHTNVHSILDSVIDSYKPIAAMKGVVFNVDSPTSMNAKVDIDMVKTLIRNQIAHAIKYSKEQSSVDITIYMDEERFTMRTKYNGESSTHGEDAKLLESVLDDVKKESGEWINMGIVKKLANLHSGMFQYMMDSPVLTASLYIAIAVDPPAPKF
jgi:two-component system sensor histidine kinase/response regulator